MSANLSGIFDPKAKTIFEIFNDAASFYNIPDYQRPYNWGDEQIEELFDDIYENYKDNVANGSSNYYFLGAIILIRKLNALEVVDGQQRLTTLIILLCVLRDFYLQDDKKIKNSIQYLVDDRYRVKFTTQLQNKNTFEQEILIEIKPELLDNIEKKKKSKFINTASIFKEKLDAISKDEIKEFSEFIFNNVSMIAITCNDPSYAIRLFQTLNDRGLNLSNSDLLKSYLYNKCDGQDAQKAFVADWNKLEEAVKDMEEDMESLLAYYEHYLLASNPKTHLYEELVKQFKNKEVGPIIYEIGQFKDSFKEIYDSDSRLIFSFRYLPNQVLWKSVLTTAKLKNIDYFDKLCKQLRRMFYLYWIAGYISLKIKYLIFNIIKLIKENKENTLELIINEIEKKIKEDNVVLLAKNNIQDNVYKKTWLKPLFILIEYQQTDDSVISFIEVNNRLHIDHVLPQGWNEIEEWKNIGWNEGYNENAYNQLNKIGNLTLLSCKKNIAQKNAPPLEKAEIYEKGHGGKTAFEISKPLIEIFKKGEWRESDVENRQKDMIMQIYELLGI